MGFRSSLVELSTPAKAVVGIVVVGAVGAALVVGVAVAGTFVMGTGEDISEQPNAMFGLNETESGAEIVHQGGDELDATKLMVTVDDTEKTWAARANGDETVAVGDSVTVAVSSGTTIEVRYDGTVLLVQEY